MKTSKVVFSVFVVALLFVSLVMPASGSISPDELYAVLAPGQSVAETKAVFVPPKPPTADVVFAFDLTGSMGGIINTAKTQAVNILGALDALSDVDIQYGVMSYMDYPHQYLDYCGYGAIYGSSGDPCNDYAYSLDRAVTDDTTSVTNAINNLVLGCGGDGPQDYTRIFYESYADPNVSWRAGAKRILVNFGDNVPHDCNLNEGVTGGTWSTGGDPGRDAAMGTSDDLDLQTVLAEMATNGVVLLEAHTTSSWASHWDYWTGLTGGARFLTGSSTLVDDIVAAVTGALEAPTVYGLHLEASVGYEGWLDSVDPASYDVDPGESGATVYFDMTIRVPDGTEPGIYNFTISALDGVGVNYGDQEVQIVVYDPSAGFVTGGGWIDSPAGAYEPDLSLTGKANFGFVSKYKKGADVPTGSTEFQFQTAGLNFHSDSYEWLLVTGKDYAKFKGVGTINGEGAYKFMLWAGDAEPDTFRIRIWTEDEENAIETVIYDNGFDQEIAGGSIVIHAK
jgi:hypothetical protein